MEAVEQAEARLEERAAARRRSGVRRDRRARIARWIVRVLAPVAGAAALLAVLERSGGDLGDFSTAAAAAIVGAAFAVPAVLVAWLARHEGVLMVLVWVLGVIAVQGALVVWVGFVALDLGPR